jgi:hypothetical protein
MNWGPRLAIFVTGGFLCPAAFAGPPPDETILRLSAESFQEREAAQSSLLDWAKRQPEPAKEWLFRRWTQESDPEVRRRCLEVLRSLVLEDYLKEGKGYVGILMQSIAIQVPDLPKAKFGIRVTMVVPDSPAAKGGINPGDVIVGVNDQVWEQAPADVPFSQWIQARAPGGRVMLKLWENGRVVDRELILGRRPDEPQGPFAGSPEELKQRDRLAREQYFQRWLEQRKTRR